MINFIKYKLVILTLTIVQSGVAKVSGDLKNRLNTDLTPLGAIKSGNGKSIPDWTNEIIKLTDESPQFIITKENYQEYKGNLTTGQMALFAQYDSFQMPIYTTYRTATAPDWVYKNTAFNAINTILNSDQTGFENSQAGIAFPIPQSALEIYFNHVSRWRGQQIKGTSSSAIIEKNGTFRLNTTKTLVRFDSYTPEYKGGNLLSLVSKTLFPSTRSGSGVLVLEPLDQLNEKRSAWLWDKGRRRVIRAPHIAYDNLVDTSSSLRTVDDTDLINGSPDRFNWQILEKREIYIPYNNVKLASKTLRYKDILHKKHINPEHTRYELHRVWVIEATLKEKWRHLYSKRTFYIDEDSWQVVIADQYNKQGDLWRVSLAYSKYYQQIPGVFRVINVFHDLSSQRYHVTGLENEVKSDTIFNGEIATDSQFTPAGFKRFMR